jgi:hypothetical protein
MLRVLPEGAGELSVTVSPQIRMSLRLATVNENGRICPPIIFNKFQPFS